MCYYSNGYSIVEKEDGSLNDEVTLLREATAGSVDALSELLQRIGPDVEASLNGKIAKHHQSVLQTDDIMQVTYLEAFLRINRFTPEGMGSFVRWLKTIAKNNLIDAIRELDRKKRPPRRMQITDKVQNDSYVTLLGNLTGNVSTPSRCAVHTEIKQLIDNAVIQLPMDYRSVIRLIDLECKTVSEAAESLGRSKGAVHMLRARAHDRLKEILGSASQFFDRSI